MMHALHHAHWWVFFRNTDVAFHRGKGMFIFLFFFVPLFQWRAFLCGVLPWTSCQFKGLCICMVSPMRRCLLAFSCWVIIFFIRGFSPGRSKSSWLVMHLPRYFTVSIYRRLVKLWTGETFKMTLNLSAALCGSTALVHVSSEIFFSFLFLF